MGVKTKITLAEINFLIKDTNIEVCDIKETTKGLSDSTYILSDLQNKYIFKIYESSSKDDIQEEIKILNALKALQVPKVLSSLKIYKNKPAVLYSYLDGNIEDDINIKQIKELAKFLSLLHNIKTYKPKNKNIYDKNNLDLMYKKEENNDEFFTRYKYIKDLNLEKNSLIHGDLFPDNVKFINNSLSGAYDFAHSTYGCSYFDISVCLVSWCFDENYVLDIKLVDEFLFVYNQNMGTKISKEFLKPYLLYACFYYALQRFLRKNTEKDYYKEYICKFDVVLDVI